MKLISSEIESVMGRSSWIRKMFEMGNELKAKYGKENVYDFSLGNPDLPPSPDVGISLEKLSKTICQPFSMGYMSNAGYPETRAKLASYLSSEQGISLPAENIVMTCGAAGGLNAFFRAVLEENDEVICPAPYFVEYGFYVNNYRGLLRPVKSKPLSFELDLAAIEQAITSKTRILLVNSPNNPTGVIYSRQEIRQLSELLDRKSKEFNKVIFLVSDEPYRFLNYDNVAIPSVLETYQYSVIIGSFSKSLSLAGERIGYIAVNPSCPNSKQLINALILTNRILGFVNAPAIGQRVLEESLGHEIDINIYKERRDLLASILKQAGIRFTIPQGAFYFFPESPLDDDKEFVNLLMAENILAVPGQGFGYPGYFRLAFCTDIKTIEKSADGFIRTMSKLTS